MLELLIWDFRVYAGAEQYGIFQEWYAPLVNALTAARRIILKQPSFWVSVKNR